MQENVRDFIRAGARGVLWDDDLVQSVRPGFTCACPNHLALLEKKTGVKYTREQVRDFFTGAPSPERSAFMDVMGESMTNFCRKMREAADELDPTVNMGICASFTHYDDEGVDMEQLIRVMVGKGCRPMLRFSGAPYWAAFAEKYKGERVTNVADFVRLQAGWFRGRGDGMILFDENDSYPRNRYLVPTSTCELYDKIVIANGGVNRHKYFLCYDYDPKEPTYAEKAYLDAHFENMADDTVLFDMFADKMPRGFRVYQSEHILRRAELGKTYSGDGAMMNGFSLPFAADILSNNSIPARFEGEGEPGICYGDSALDLTDAQMKNGIILDAPAALALQRRGIDVGADLAVADWKADCETFPGGQKQAFEASKTQFYTLTPHEGAEVLCTYGNGSPSCVWYENPLGYRFAIFAFDGRTICAAGWGGASLLPSFPRQALLCSLYRRMAGHSLPVIAAGAPWLYTLVSDSADGSRRSVLICMDGPTAAAPTLQLDGKWKLVSALRVTAEVADDGTTVRVSKIAAYDWAAVELEKV